MAQDGFKNTLTALILFVAFSVMILTVAIDFGAEYGMDANEIGDGSLKLVDYEQAGANVSSDASSYRSRFDSGDVDNIDDASGIFSILTDAVNLITTPFSLIAQVLNNLLGIPVLITNIILGILSIGLILGIWSVLRQGS